MKTILILFVAFAVASAAKTHSKRSLYSANLNNYVDRVISNLQASITENDRNSISIPNVTESFSVKPLWITYSGRLSLYEGVLSNLASVRRYGDVTVTYADNILALSSNLGIDSVGIDYTYESKLIGFLSASGTVDGSATKVDTTTTLSANLKDYTLTLDSFVVNSVGTIKAKLGGSALTDWFANIILNLVLPIIKKNVTTGFETSVTSIISSNLDEINAMIAALLES